MSAFGSGTVIMHENTTTAIFSIFRAPQKMPIASRPRHVPTVPIRSDFGPLFEPKHEAKQPHDVADVLLSLKHAVVHPGQTSPSYYPQTQCGVTSSPSASLSYTVHPHQVRPGS
ncbi:hypothetical protein J6590_064154 [Homalodisca vitripennis]|nr:hypothetical protein J6590_064154 [Homalodisca vitripennis]